jgi:SAM-dependent methyltransferase
MGSSETGAFHAEQYDHVYPDGIQNHYWVEARHRILYRHVGPLVRGDSGAVVLDIGCGRGLSVDYLRGKGIHAYGCDLANPIPITPGTAPYLRLGTDAFALESELREAVRVVLLLDVLEHMAEPRAFLSRCHDVFPRCRHVLVTLPARMEIWSNYDTYYGHYLRYDRKSANRVIPSDRFALVREGYFFHLLYPPALAIALMRIDRSLHVRAPGPGQRWAHRLVSAYLDLEDRLLPASWPGTSLYTLLERK